MGELTDPKNEREAEGNDILVKKQNRVENYKANKIIIDEELVSFERDSDLLIATLKEGKDVDSEGVREIKDRMANRLKKIEQLTKNL